MQCPWTAPGLGSLPEFERFNMGTFNITSAFECWVMSDQEPGEGP